jgi:hypothetical protein
VENSKTREKQRVWKLLRHSLKRATASAPLLSHLDMENLENSMPLHIDFWKGLVLGTMAGMIIAACTYSRADRNFKEPGETSSSVTPVQNRKTAA